MLSKFLQTIVAVLLSTTLTSAGGRYKTMSGAMREFLSPMAERGVEGLEDSFKKTEVKDYHVSVKADADAFKEGLRKQMGSDARIASVEMISEDATPRTSLTETSYEITLSNGKKIGTTVLFHKGVAGGEYAIVRISASEPGRR